MITQQQARSTLTAATSVAASHAHAGATMRAEPVMFAAATVVTAAIGDGRLPADQVLFLWSLAGTAVGAGVASLGMPASKLGARVMRAALSFFAGMLIAPWVMAQLPRAAATPDWWHAFAASGIGASIVYVLVAEGPSIVRAIIRARTGKDNER